MSIARWKTPQDLKDWLAKRFGRDVAGHLRQPEMVPVLVGDSYQIAAPGLTAGLVADRFHDIRAWAREWQALAKSESDIDVTFAEWPTRQFGRVHTPKTVQTRSIDAAARLLGRTRDLTRARTRYVALSSIDRRFDVLADRWPDIIAMPDGDFETLTRFLSEAAALDLGGMRLREVPCAGMHTKFLERHRKLVSPVLAALSVTPNASAQSWPGRLGFVEDDTRLLTIRDLDGGLLAYAELALAPSLLCEASPVRLIDGHRLGGVVIVENQATFHSLPPLPGVIALFGQGAAVQTLSAAGWLRTVPILYLGDLDHAGYRIIARLRRHGLAHIETALMDLETAEAHERYWVTDTSTAGAERDYAGLQRHESAAQVHLARGPWRLEQERISFDVLAERLLHWRHRSA